MPSNDKDTPKGASEKSEDGLGERLVSSFAGSPGETKEKTSTLDTITPGVDASFSSLNLHSFRRRSGTPRTRGDQRLSGRSRSGSSKTGISERTLSSQSLVFVETISLFETMEKIAYVG